MSGGVLMRTYTWILFFFSTASIAQTQPAHFEEFFFFGNKSEYYLINPHPRSLQLLLAVQPSPALISAFNNIKNKDEIHLKSISVYINSNSIKHFTEHSKNISLKTYREVKSKNKILKITHPISVKKVIYLKNPNALEDSQNIRPQYLLFGNESQLWVAHFKSTFFPFFHIMKIQTNSTATYLLTRSQRYSLIENIDLKNLREPFLIDIPLVAKIKNATTLYLSFNGEQELYIDKSKNKPKTALSIDLKE